MRRLTVEVVNEIEATLKEFVTLQFPSQDIEVTVKAASVGDALAVFAITQGHDERNAEVNKLANVEMAARCIVEDGQAIFDSPQGREALAKLPGGILQRIGSEALRMSGIDGRVVEKKS